MNELLFKTFIKNYQDVKDPAVRDSYGKFAGIVGILSNTILCIMKMAIGFLSGSIAIVADAVNNLADASSSVITLVGFKLASLPEDKEHPYGHARIEYLAGLLVSVIIIVVGFELGKSSVDKILHPTATEFSITLVIVLVLAIAIKIWQAFFNISTGRKINSLALMATGADSRNDVISTSAVLLGSLIGYFLDVQIDGYMGVAVAAFIMWSGFCLVKETVSPLLGEAPDPEIVEQIEEITMGYDGVLGIHDLVVHNYGPGKIFASVHIEVDSAVDVMVSHDLIDNIEFHLARELKIHVTAHMDPINISDPNREPLKALLSQEIRDIKGVLGFHDLRIVPGQTHTNVIFDLLLAPKSQVDAAAVHDRLAAAIKGYDPLFETVINFDVDYVGFDEK